MAGYVGPRRPLESAPVHCGHSIVNVCLSLGRIDNNNNNHGSTRMANLESRVSIKSNSAIYYIVSY